ncbi:MAG: hypothetical protein WCH98_10340 [Verrucomicrobiota bacterium]
MKAAGAILVFVATSVAAAVALAFPMGGLSPQVTWAAFAIGLVAAVFAWRGIRFREFRPPSAWDILLLIIFALASMRAFLWLLYPVGDEWRVLSPNNLGDISLHIHLIRYLSGGVDFWPASPILAGAQLTYPLGVDLFNSLLLCAGVPLEKGLIWVGLFGAGLSGWALWRWGGAFAVAALLFNGGLAGFLVFQTGQISDFQTELPWKNFFLAMFVTQRGLLYALPCGLFLLSAWREDFFGGGSGVPRWVTFLLYATMPLFSAHAFVFLSFVLACAFLVAPRQRMFLAAFVACAIPPATAALFYVTGHFAASSGLRWLPGWMQKSDAWLNYANNSGHLWLHDPAAWIFWIWNFGISLPLLLLLGCKIIWTRRKDAICFAGTGLFVFLVCCFVSFAPWEWDNTKLFLWAWLACAPFLWEMISKWPAPVRAITCFLLFFSGAVSLVGGLDGRHGYKLTSRSELATAAAVLASVPFEDRIAVEPDFNNPVILLGRPVLCGYEGHLWSHGLDYHRQWNALQKVLKQEPGWQGTLDQLDARWFFVKANPPVIVPLPRADSSPKSSPTM